MLKAIGGILLLAILLILALALMKPSTYSVERSTDIAAAPDKIAPLVNDFHHWGEWDPWGKLDPNMKVTYGGAPSGVGATYDWVGNSKVGQGHMEIVSVEPTKTTIKLDFLKPFKSESTNVFTLAPQGSGTHVTWTMGGPTNFMTKVMLVFTSMDKMIGPDFERGLVQLKTLAEKP